MPTETLKGWAPTRRDDEELGSIERSQYLEAARRASWAYPGALGELVQRELVAFVQFGYRLTGDGLIPRLAAEILAEVQDNEATGRSRRATT